MSAETKNFLWMCVIAAVTGFASVIIAAPAIERVGLATQEMIHHSR